MRANFSSEISINTYFKCADNLFVLSGGTPTPFFRYLCVK